ncbi:MAG: hypothetical protein H7258_14745 [Ferruginibacter sp.]|nr:hypothetical protein [Ferruginibacter sp.]
MNIQLLQGQFDAKDAIDLITNMIHIKVKYHENKINNSSSEEDIKFRETKIKRLQKELYEFRNNIDEKNGNVKLDAIIQIGI